MAALTAWDKQFELGRLDAEIRNDD